MVKEHTFFRTPDMNYWDETGRPHLGVRTFETGANRTNDTDKIDPEGFLSPLVLRRFCEYMHMSRFLPDGTFRDSDNWQKGIPREAYMKSLWRHFLAVWEDHRYWKGNKTDESTGIEDDLCGVMFNAMGMLHEILKEGEQNV